MALKLYFDLMSPPSRALYIMLKSIKYDFELKKVNLTTNEQLSNDYAKLNRFKKVPVIDHNGFILTESIAITKYLSRENIIPESLYPKECQHRARVDEFMEWQHIGLRMYTGLFFLVKYLEPMKTQKSADPKQVAKCEQNMVTALEDFNTKWLGRGTDFLVGNNPTAADVLAICELEQPRLAGYNPKENFANIREWAKRIQEHFNPHYDEAHAVLNKVIAIQAQMATKAL